MAKQIVPNPEWVTAPYEMVLFDNKSGARVTSFDRVNDGPSRYCVDAEGNLYYVPKYIEKEEESNGAT